MKAAANLLLALASLAAGLALCEAALRVFHPRYEYAAVPPQRGYYWQRLYPRPDTGERHLVVYNNLGGRQHRNFGERDLAPAVNVAFFGDSFTENLFLPVQYSFTEVLDFLLNQNNLPPAPRINVLNFGQNGTGPGQQYRLYQSLAAKRQLGHVFYVHCHNDLDDLRAAARNDPQVAGMMHKIKLSPWMRALSRLHLTYLALDVWQRLGLDDLTPRHFDMSVPDALVALDGLLRRWRQEVEANGGVFHVVLLPITDNDRWFRKTDALASWDVLDLAECFEERIPNYQYNPVSSANAPYYYWHFRTDGHWNEAGNMVAAHCLYRHLERFLGLPERTDAELARARGAYYGAFHDSDVWHGRRWMPGPPWALPGSPANGRASRILARYLALREDAPAIQEHVAPLRRGQHAAALRRRMGPVVIAKAMATSEHILRGRDGWSAHLSREHRLVVLKKKPCDARETGQAIFMRVVPWSPADLGIGERQQGFAIVPPHMLRNALRRTPGDDDECVLPADIGTAPAASVVVGERDSGGKTLWKFEFPVDPAGEWRRVAAEHRRRYRTIARTPPAARSVWNIHMLAARRELVLLKEPCALTDTLGRFFVRLRPVDRQAAGRTETPDDHEMWGVFERRGVVGVVPAFQNMDLHSVAMFDEVCAMTVRLPQWAIAAVQVGQVAPDGQGWQAKFYADVEGLRRAYRSVAAAEPTATGAFDLHRQGQTLVYVREPCAEADVRHRFFLHVEAAPSEGGHNSRANLGFDFGERGALIDGKCVAVVPLPEAAPGTVTRLRTGQFSSAGTTWVAELD